MPQYLTGMRKQNTTFQTAPAPSATMLGGGRAASQAAALAAPKQTQNNPFAQNTLNNTLNALNVKTAGYEGVTPTYTPATPSGGAGGDGGGSLQAAPVQTDPYAGIYSLYEQQLNAQRDALAQQRQARLDALRANYSNAKSKLDSSFASGEADLNQDADEALREAYISSMLNQRALNQQLLGQGITGGAAESVLARAYNNYGNDRNAIERNRMDRLTSLLNNYQGTLGDIENSYLAGMADADSDYSGSIANAMTSYYDRLANMQAQNAASQYRNALGKSGSSSSAKAEDPYKDVLSVGKSYKGNASGFKKYMDALGIPEQDQRMLQMQVGNDPDSIAAAQAQALEDTLYEIPATARNTILNTLRRIYPTSAQDGLSSNESLYRNVITELNRLARQYGLTDAQAQALLAEAGF